MAIGLLLMSVAWILASRTKDLLLGEGVDPDELADIQRRVESDPAVEKAGDILTMYMGPEDLLVNMGVCFVKGYHWLSRCTRQSAALKPTYTVRIR